MSFFSFLHEWMYAHTKAYHTLHDDIQCLVEKYTNSASTIIDVPVATGNIANRLIVAGYKVRGFDLSEEHLAHVRKRIPSKRLNLAKLDLQGEVPKEIGDVLINVHLLHFLSEPQKALRNMHKMLRPNGVAIIVCYKKSTFLDAARKRVLLWKCVETIYNSVHGISNNNFLEQTQLRQMIKKAGFQVVRIQPIFEGLSNVCLAKKI